MIYLQDIAFLYIVGVFINTTFYAATGSTIARGVFNSMTETLNYYLLLLGIDPIEKKEREYNVIKLVASMLLWPFSYLLLVFLSVVLIIIVTVIEVIGYE